MDYTFYVSFGSCALVSHTVFVMGWGANTLVWSWNQPRPPTWHARLQLTQQAAVDILPPSFSVSVKAAHSSSQETHE